MDSVVVPSTYKAGRGAEDERNRGHLGFLPVAVRKCLDQTSRESKCLFLAHGSVTQSTTEEKFAEREREAASYITFR